MPSPVAPAPGAGYAGFWRRFAAALIDGVILLLGTGVVGALVYLFIHGLNSAMRVFSWREAEQLILFLAWVAGVVLGWLYFTILESPTWQSTLGKRALGIVVTDLGGRRISFGRATGRHFGKLVSSLTLTIGFLMAGFTARKHHDMMAACLVTRSR